MGVDNPVWRFFAVKVVQHLDEYGVFQDVGVVAGVEGVTIAKQRVSSRHSMHCGA
jgi:hypothetical protein